MKQYFDEVIMRFIYYSVIIFLLILLTASTGVAVERPELKDEVYEVTSILPSTLNLRLQQGEQTEIEASVMPEDATERELSWRLSNQSSIAELIPYGDRCIVKAVRPGRDVLVVEAQNQVKGEVNITVKEAVASKIVFYNDTDSISPGETALIKAVILPEDSADSRVSWDILNGGENAKISYGGNLCKIIGERAGSVIVTASANDGMIQNSLEVNIKSDIKRTDSCKEIIRVLIFGGWVLVTVAILYCAFRTIRQW